MTTYNWDLIERLLHEVQNGAGHSFAPRSVAEDYAAAKAAAAPKVEKAAAVAEKIVVRDNASVLVGGAAAKKLGPEARRRSATDRSQLPGADLESIEAEIVAARSAVPWPDVAEHLVLAHGSLWRDVWTLAEADSSLAERLVPALPYIGAELRYL